MTDVTISQYCTDVARYRTGTYMSLPKFVGVSNVNATSFDCVRGWSVGDGLAPNHSEQHYHPRIFADDLGSHHSGGELRLL